MKLTTRALPLELRHTFTIAHGSEDVTPVVFAELAAEGLVGIGEASPADYHQQSTNAVQQALASIRDYVAQADPLHYQDLLVGAAEFLDKERAALCALDLAVHDWISRKLDQPLYRLLGLNPAKIPISSFTIGIDTVPRMVEKLREAKNYPVIKIKLGTKDDVAIVRNLRRETNAVFRVDANCGWTAEETIAKSIELKALGVEFIEQPLPVSELEAMEEVFAKSALPLIADENAMVPEDVLQLRGKYHGINIKLVKCGGILPALRMVHLARALGMKVMLGCMIESSVGITAAAQIGALADYVDLDGNVLITNDPYRGVQNHNGRLVLPPLGVEKA